MKLFVLLSITCFVAGACSDQPEPTATRRPLLSAQLAAFPGASDTDLVAAPNGYYYHRNCVYAAPTTLVVNRKHEVIGRADRPAVSSTCTATHPTARRRGFGHSQPNFVVDSTGAPTDTGSVIFSEDLTVGHTYRSLAANWVVPDEPYLDAYGAGQTFFTWPGLMDSTTVIQPVLQYGSNGVFGGDYYTIADWACRGATCWVTQDSLFHVFPGDTISGSITAVNCSSGFCDWEVTIIDVNLDRGIGTTFTHSEVGSYASDNKIFAIGGSAEVKGLTSCDQWPPGGVHFSSEALANETGSVTPSFSKIVNPAGVSPACGFGVQVSTTTTDLLDSAATAVQVSIDGPSSVSGSGTWSADFPTFGPHAPVGPVTYSWGGILGGSSSSVTGTPSGSGTLTLEVWDATGRFAFASLDVTVCDPHTLGC